jgi:hypothetical protein
MVDTDPAQHPFTAGYGPLGGGAGDPDDGAPTPVDPAAEDEADPAANNPPALPQQGGSERDFADRLRVDPARGDAKG